MPDAVRVELLFRGVAVDDGSMPVEDMIDALSGFSGAYRKISRHYRLDAGEESIRVVALQKGSSQILLEIADWVVKNPAPAGVGATVGLGLGAGAYTVIKDLAKVIWARKELHGQTLNNTFTINNNVIVVGNVPLTPQQSEFLQSHELDFDLDKMTAPLDKGRGVDEFELKSGNEELVRVVKTERLYLRRRAYAVPPLEPERRRKMTRENGFLEGTFISHSKKSNRGIFETASGRVKYRYLGQDISTLLRAYTSRGAVGVYGRVAFDPDHQPVSMDIWEIKLPE